MLRDRRRVNNSSRLLDGRGLDSRPMQIPGKNVSKLITISASKFCSKLLAEAHIGLSRKGKYALS